MRKTTICQPGSALSTSTSSDCLSGQAMVLCCRPNMKKKRINTLHIQLLRGCLGSLFLIGLGGCVKTPKPVPPPPPNATEPPKPAIPKAENSGTVSYINEVGNYVILKTRKKPPAHEVWGFYRKNTKMGLLKIGRQDQDVYIDADIISGSPEVGDYAQPEPPDPTVP